MITLHYGKGKDLKNENDILNIKFKTTKALIKFFKNVVLENDDKETIYVLTNCSNNFEDSYTDVFIFENVYRLTTLFKVIEAVVNGLDEKNVFLQEYSNYEDAYKVALSMRETNKLCYDKD